MIDNASFVAVSFMHMKYKRAISASGQKYDGLMQRGADISSVHKNMGPVKKQGHTHGRKTYPRTD